MEPYSTGGDSLSVIRLQENVTPNLDGDSGLQDLGPLGQDGQDEKAFDTVFYQDYKRGDKPIAKAEVTDNESRMLSTPL